MTKRECRSTSLATRSIGTSLQHLFCFIRHVGDLGNIIADDNGDVITNIRDSQVTLYGTTSVIGRAIVVSHLRTVLSL